MIVYGCYKTEDDQQLVKERCKRLKLPKPHLIDLAQGVVPVTIQALRVLRRGSRVAIVADLQGVTAPELPEQAFTDVEWRESWLAYLDANAIPFYPLSEQVKDGPSALTRTSAIRAFRSAVSALEGCIAAGQKPVRGVSELSYVCGRPPYGYQVEKKQLIIHKAQAKAVEHIFRLIRDGLPIREVVRVMEATRGSGEDYWDRKKVARILSHATLYCLGSYEVRGQTLTLSQLVFLPPKWAGTVVAKPIPEPRPEPTRRPRATRKGMRSRQTIPRAVAAGTIGSTRTPP